MNSIVVGLRKPEPKFIKGFWADKNKKKLNTKDASKNVKAGDKVYAYVKTDGIPDDTECTVRIKEWDPTIFDPDEDVKTVTAKTKDNCIHRKLKIDHTWYANESDRLSEIYFEIDSSFKLDGHSFELSETYPADTDDYLYVVDKGVLITVIIKLPHSKSTDKWEAKGLGGHTGIAIGKEFYDYGPDISRYSSGGDPITGVEGIPWWDKIIMDDSGGSIKKLSDVDLSHILNYA